MNAFIVELANQPGRLARVAEAIANKGINIDATAAIAWGDRGAVALMTNDEAGTRRALEAAGIGFRESELIGIRLPDRPGTLAEVSRRLADAGVNIELILRTGSHDGQANLAIGVDKVAAAREALREYTAVAAG